jgi:hypothetical protein
MKHDLRRRWRALPLYWINPAAADYVFPDDRSRFSLLTWNFYSWLVFQESLQGKCDGITVKCSNPNAFHNLL